MASLLHRTGGCLAGVVISGSLVFGAEFHVAMTGNDSATGSRTAPLRSIQRAAERAQPGDVITVHQGVYRERVNPPRGGLSDRRRIVYQAAPGEKVEIRGSERITNWVKVQDGVWRATLPNGFFASFNPYTNSIHGDWFNPKGRPHHTGAVYLNGHWLVEAAALEEVLANDGVAPAWLSQGGEQYLLNILWLKPANTAAEFPAIPASAFAAQHGVQTAPSTEGGDCIGWIETGDWVRYDKVDFGSGSDRVQIRIASATSGGRIEVRMDSVVGELLGSCFVPHTGGWQNWSTVTARIKRLSGLNSICLLFKPSQPQAVPEALANAGLWFARVDDSSTTIWARFKDADPNQAETEINVRQTVFYPDQPGRNYITLRGFVLSHAATPWAPPTAEQIGLVGTHWSKGWIIESNLVSHSVCSGIALGKHGDQYDNTSADTAEGYVKTIERALARGWHRDNIGHHTVRYNTISHCEQAGLVGSLGAAFSAVYGNSIHDIHVRRLFTGAEMAGIKFHAAIDTVIRNNHIYNTVLGLWLDWMAQGTRVSANLFHDNARDLFVEVNHGPFLVDNNLFLSGANLLDMSQGGAYAHNLFAGSLVANPEMNRETPFHPPHSTAVSGLQRVPGGDNRFYNNIFVGPGAAGANVKAYGLAMYDSKPFPVFTGGNVFYRGARALTNESSPLLLSPVDPSIQLVTADHSLLLQHQFGTELDSAHTSLVTTKLLGHARIPNLPYVNPDDSPIKIDRDYLGRKRHTKQPSPGPFENPATGQIRLKFLGE